MPKSLKITLTSGLVGKQRCQKAVVRALGLRKYGSSVVHANSPTITGMVRKVSHLVTVITVESPAQKKKAAGKRI